MDVIDKSDAKLLLFLHSPPIHITDVFIIILVFWG